MEDKRIVKVPAEEFDNDFMCECGNNSAYDGFFACNEKGEQIEPNIGEWDGLYVCARCEIIIQPVDDSIN